MVDKLEVLIIGLKNRVDLLVVVVVYISSVVGILVDLLGWIVYCCIVVLGILRVFSSCL